MTDEEAHEVLEDLQRILTSYRHISKELTEANGIAIQALEKQIPKKPNLIAGGYWNGELVYDTWVCPSCGAEYETDCDQHKFCPECGQRIEWSDEE